MKKNLLLAQFLVIFFFLAVPPLLKNSEAQKSVTIRFGLTSLLSLAIAFPILQEKKRRIISAPEKKDARTKAIMTALSFFALLLSALIIIFFARLFSSETKSAAPQIPKGVFEWLNFAAGTLLAALYEEVIYRVFLPGAAETLFVKDKKRERFHLLIIEGAVIALFALSHRYLGIPAVLNALAGGAILRVCYKKTGSIIPSLASHSLYNLSAIIFTAIALSLS